MSKQRGFDNIDDFSEKLLDKWMPIGFAAVFGIIGAVSLAGFIITGMWHCLLFTAMSAAMVWALVKSIKEEV